MRVGEDKRAQRNEFASAKAHECEGASRPVDMMGARFRRVANVGDLSDVRLRSAFYRDGFQSKIRRKTRMEETCFDRRTKADSTGTASWKRTMQEKVGHSKWLFLSVTPS